MAKDYEEVYDLEDMSDEDLHDLVVQKLREVSDVDVDRIDVRVEAGHVLLEGRVGTEQELQQVDQVVTDVLGIDNATNDVIVDALVRSERSTAADVAASEDARAEPVLGGGGQRTSDTAEHLMADTESDQYGTGNPSAAAERGFSYNPPTGPNQEGSRSRETH